MQEENLIVSAINGALPPAEGESENNSGIARLEQLEKDYALLQEKYDILQKQNTLDKICSEIGCTDPGYFEFCVNRAGIQLADQEKVRHFARELAATSPGCFIARITPGSNAGNSHASASAANPPAEVPHGDRISMIAMSIDHAPDAVSR